jgi:hypothetical protein
LVAVQASLQSVVIGFAEIVSCHHPDSLGHVWPTEVEKRYPSGKYGGHRNRVCDLPVIPTA